ncbi:MAG: ATP-dependent DNA helicase [Proteobacteria bacterium]|nr:ATP-dependent DNA helicase [Pseudomonadota bacterium]
MDAALPYATALAIHAGWAALTPDGELLGGALSETKNMPKNAVFLVCHLPYVSTRINLPAPAIDILELFAFVKPAAFCVPTIGGVATALGHPVPQNAEDAALALPVLTKDLLRELSETPEKDRPKLITIAEAMGQQGQGWGWAQCVIETLGGVYDPNKPTKSREALNVWSNLPEWAEDAPQPAPSALPVTGEEARNHLHDLVTRRKGAGREGEMRQEQENYATRIIATFAARQDENEPNVVTAEAGTGVGKTLGYLAPAQLWAERNEGAVWISTYTRNLQRQIDSELSTLYPDASERALKTVIRKGRENYLCLLNYEDLAGAASMARDPRTVIAAGLMARWISATRDGDMTGADFPGWLAGLLKIENTTGLADRRGECVYAACDHYHRCFIEKAQRKAKRARIIVGNHALAMYNLAMSDSREAVPTRYIFDEGHHLFDAADSTFAIHLTGAESADFRRWLLGPEDDNASRRMRRSKGLKKRLEGLMPEGDEAQRYLDEALHAARALPVSNWRKNMSAGTPKGSVEELLLAIYRQVKARAQDPTSGWTIECDVHPLDPDVMAIAPKCMAALRQLHRPLMALAGALRKKLVDEYDLLNPDFRARLDALSKGIENRATNTVGAWIDMLASLKDQSPKSVIDWFEIERIDGKDYDVGFLRHHRDPAVPFATELKPHAHGVLVTSATLKATRDTSETSWMETDRMTGMAALSPLAPVRVAIPSPFNYREQTRVLIVRDVSKTDNTLLAKAYEGLFAAARGGALGLFTAIHRLRAAHARLAPALEAKGIPVYAQHVDNIDIGTLVDIFRAEEDACLLGTDAARDGVDVPGRSLRLIVFDRVPWPRPTILHRERKKTFGGKAYEEMLTRMKLRQAYGRLVRTPADHGVFVMLDSAFPSRLEDSFPEGVTIQRVSLDEAIGITRDFLSSKLPQEKAA